MERNGNLFNSIPGYGHASLVLPLIFRGIREADSCPEGKSIALLISFPALMTETTVCLARSTMRPGTRHLVETWCCALNVALEQSQNRCQKPSSGSDTCHHGF